MCVSRLREEEEQPNLELPLDDNYNRFLERIKSTEAERRKAAGEAPWGGWTRRYLAFMIDLVILASFSLLLFYLTYIAYSVGLAANQRSLSAYNETPFWRFTCWGSLFLCGWYFVLFHAMAGRTLGKWLLGLRVVGPNRSPITYRQSLKRWIGYFLSAFLGLGFLWILISRERRGWHDYLAGTWVIRDRSSGSI
ncbi:MAG: RDD family protein [Candidatus Binatia bacterium]